MSHQEEKLKFIENEIELKEEVLTDLTKELNNIHEALEIAKGNYAQELEKESSAFMKKMSEFEEELKHPEETLDLVYTDLENKRRDLESYKQELVKWQDSLTTKEKQVYDIEEDLESLKSTAILLWNKLFENITADIRSNREIIDQRSKLLDIRFKRLEKEEKSIKDKIASLRSLQNEILTKRVQNNG